MKEIFHIRPLNNADSHQAIALILPIQQQEFGVAIDIGDQPDLIDIDTCYHQAGGNFWGMFEGELLVGTIALLAIGQGAGALRKMFVRKEYRGKEHGIAQQLLDHLLRFCAVNNILDIYLGTVMQMKAAQRFYERNGFEKTDAEALPSYFPKIEVDNCFYHLILSQPE